MGRLGPNAGGLALTAVMLSAMCVPMQATPLARVAVRVFTSAGVDNHIVAPMFRELVSTWSHDDVDVVRDAEGINPPAVATVSLVISAEWPPAAVARSLGWMRFVTSPDPAGRTVPIPNLMVSIPATRALVDATRYRGGPVVQLPRDLRTELLARALGRVAAHELGHYLLASREHAPHGLMRAQFHPDDLVAEDASTFCLNAGERQTLQARLRHAQFLLAEKQE